MYLTLWTVEPFVHASLDRYAFVAVAPSISTLQHLITMVRTDNQRRQETLNAKGRDLQRSLDVCPISELIASVGH